MKLYVTCKLCGKQFEKKVSGEEKIRCPYCEKEDWVIYIGNGQYDVVEEK